MIKYTNIGFTEKEAEIIDEYIVGLQKVGGFYARSYSILPAGQLQSTIDHESHEEIPFALSVVERSGEFTAVFDTAHSTLFLIDTARNKVVHGQEIVILDNAIMLNANIYSADYFIFIANNKTNNMVHVV